MKQTQPEKDYYDVLGAHRRTSRRDIHRLYKRLAALHHPDRGGSEEDMKVLNEAYDTLKNDAKRREYDARRRLQVMKDFVPASAPTARDVGLSGQCLSAFLCLFVGMFLLLLVWSQWFWFLWPLVILAFLVIGLGLMMTRSALLAVRASLPQGNLLHRHTGVQEVVFWMMVFGGVYAIYLLLTAVR